MRFLLDVRRSRIRSRFLLHSIVGRSILFLAAFIVSSVFRLMDRDSRLVACGSWRFFFKALNSACRESRAAHRNGQKQRRQTDGPPSHPQSHRIASSEHLPGTILGLSIRGFSDGSFAGRPRHQGFPQQRAEKYYQEVHELEGLAFKSKHRPWSTFQH